MKKNTFKSLSLEELYSTNGGQTVPIQIHTNGVPSDIIKQIRNKYDSMGLTYILVP